jgi:hypothetical protein
MKNKRWGSRLVTKMTRAFPVLLIIGGMILSFASQPLPVVGMSSSDRAVDAIEQVRSSDFWVSGEAAVAQAQDGYVLTFIDPEMDTAVCLPDPVMLEATIQVTVPEGVEVRLQVNWYLVHPDELREDIEYIEAGLVTDGDTYTWQAPWPGIRPEDDIVELAFGAALIDPETAEIYATKTLDIYWYPWVCPVVGDPTETPVTPTLTETVMTPDPLTPTPTETQVTLVPPTATPTETPVTPTLTETVMTPDPLTPTPTETQVTLVPPTATPTETPVPPTLTPTPTVTQVTPVPPTPTSTPTETPVPTVAIPADTPTPIVFTATPIIEPGPVFTATPIVVSGPSFTATPIIVSGPSFTATPIVVSGPSITATPVVIIPPPIQATAVVIIPEPILATPVMIIPPPIQATPQVIIPPPIQATPQVIIPEPIMATPVMIIPDAIQATPVVIIPPPIQATPVVIIPEPIVATPLVIVPEPIQATPVVLEAVVITATPVVVAPEELPVTGVEPPVDKPVVVPTLEVPQVAEAEEFIPVTGADLTHLYAQPAALEEVDWKVAVDLVMAIAGLISILAGVIFLFSPNRQI